MNSVVIYTDGSSKGNPGPGGWSAIIIEGDQSRRKRHILEIAGREEGTTNNRMELRAVIEGLRQTKENSEIEVYADSEYVIKGITIWIKNWQKNNWKTSNKKEVLNKDLWLSLLEETEKRNIKWKKVVGHSGDFYNERCDMLATSFADNKNIKLFEGSESDYKK